MFDAGMLEMTVVAVIALLVIGPERLPKVARSVGHMIGRAKAILGRFQQEMEVQARNLDMKERLEKNRQLLAEYEKRLSSPIVSQAGEEKGAAELTTHDKAIPSPVDGSGGPAKVKCEA